MSETNTENLTLIFNDITDSMSCIDEMLKEIKAFGRELPLADWQELRTQLTEVRETYLGAQNTVEHLMNANKVSENQGIDSSEDFITMVTDSIRKQIEDAVKAGGGVHDIGFNATILVAPDSDTLH